MDGLDLIFRVLHGDKVIVSVLWIDPVARGDHHVRSECGDQVVDHFLRSEAELRGAIAIHVYLKSGIIHVLRDVDIGYAFRSPDLAGQILRDFVIGFQIHAAHLHVNRCGHALIQHCVDQTTRLKIRAELRKLCRDAPAYFVHVDETAGAVIFLEAHLNECGVHSGVRSEQRRQIGHNADIRNHCIEILGFYNLAHDLFNLLYVVVGDFDASARRSLHVDDELAGIGAREKRNSDEWNEKEAEQEYSSKNYQGFPRAVESLVYISLVNIQHFFKLSVEAGVESCAPGLLGFFAVGMGRFQEVRAEQWNHRDRIKIRGSKREDHSQSQGREQILADAE